MNPFFRTALTALAMTALATPAYPWGVEGHKALALAAGQELTPEARSHVIQILGSDDLATIAVWMDEVRAAYFHNGPLGTDPEALKFNAEFPKNGEWHYVDMPLGTKAYQLDAPFATPHDVVHELEEAVAVLEGGGDHRITKREALCMIVHFVGDLHQPFHVGNGYYQVSAEGAVTLVTDPAAAKGLPNDKGGNALFFGPDRFDELHAYWDDTLVRKVAQTKDEARLATVLGGQIAASKGAWATPGDYHHWPEAWATESIQAANIAFAGVVFGAETPDNRGGIKSIRITLPANYDATCVPLAEERLSKAAYHLAEILNAIHWSG